MKEIMHYPFISNKYFRGLISFIVLIVIIFYEFNSNELKSSFWFVTVFVGSWLISIFLTDKYIHKYPQRYYTYILASHLKAAFIMALVLIILIYFISSSFEISRTIYECFLIFVILDLIISLPNAKVNKGNEVLLPKTMLIEKHEHLTECESIGSLPMINSHKTLSKLKMKLENDIYDFVERIILFNLGSNNKIEIIGSNDKIEIIDDIELSENDQDKVAALIGNLSLNEVKRLNKYLAYTSNKTLIGGYLIVKYIPIENKRKVLRKRFSSIQYYLANTLHFFIYSILSKIPGFGKLYFSSKMNWLDKLYISVAKGRNRNISKAEAWGRLSYFGFEVISELENNDLNFIVAKKVSEPIRSDKVSYYLVVKLEKVGLRGEMMYLHKIRTMFPFSEYLQKRIYNENGLASTGKFANDFRLTRFGKFLRKYWLDEIPQIFDWFRGEIKLVGMRATSKHFLSLYPKELYDMYIRIKPGLIPPIFDENTNGFDQIVQIELNYLKSYLKNPFYTDIKYFYKTFSDIVFRGVRSK